MTSSTARLPFSNTQKSDGGNAFDITAWQRKIVWVACVAMSLAVLIALLRAFTGLAPAHPHARSLAIIIHVATVLPAIPLGGYLLLARKGGVWHKRLGKIWVALMVTTALSTLFIRFGEMLSPIHVFVPMTLVASYKLIMTARRGDMKGHKKEIMSLYLGALMIPGLVAIAMPGRMMNAWLFG